jgi:hypothetical protein
MHELEGDPVMKTTLALLVASTALTAAIGVPAWSAMSGSAAPEDRSLAAAFDPGGEALPLIFVSDDDDDDDDRRYRRSSGRDDDNEDDDCDDDDDDEEGCRGAANPAPAGSVAPPANGLFGNGAPPQVKVN